MPWQTFVRAAGVAGFIAMAFVLMTGRSHAAGCHVFSRWFYPWPQRCGIVVKRAPVTVHLAASTDRYAIAPADIDKLRAAMLGAGK